MNRHLLSSADLSRDDVETILATAESMHDVQKRDVKKIPTLRGRTIINLFFEDSTRTRSSFEIAGKWMSADTINITGKGSSTSKGESLRDTVRTIDAMSVDALVIRHHASGRLPPGRPVGRRERHQRRGRHPRAPDPGPARRVRPPQADRRPRRPARRHRRRPDPLAGVPLQRHHPRPARRARHGRRAADPHAERHRRLVEDRRVRHLVGPGRGPRGRQHPRSGRRRDDAARPAASG